MKLNLGAGKNFLPDYVNIDRRFHEEVFPIGVMPLNENIHGSASLWNLNRETHLWNPKDESCEEVRASHILEHFSYRETESVLREWIRVLKPGGWLKIAVPDFKWICEHYLDDNLPEESRLTGYLMGGQVDENDYHKSVFDEEGLREAFEVLGLVNVQRWESEIQDCASLPVSLNLMGQKPLRDTHNTQTNFQGILPSGEVVAVMSIPRLAFTDNTFSLLQGVAALGLRVLKSSGVFWGQCLTELMETAIQGGAKYVLTIDYDTVFRADDVRRLYALAEKHEADALFPLQMKRDSESPLFTQTKGVFQEELTIPKANFEVDLYPVQTGHFGLTLLRTASFAKLAKPWFRSRPDEEGRWGANRVDEDIAFWRNWTESGNTLFLAPSVSIGHLQLVATWPDRNLKARHQYLSEFHQQGKPDWAWR